MGNTRERILQTALRLFASDGYEAVSTSDISSALGITKGALYKHYQNKRDIFDSIIARMEQQDTDQAECHDLPDGTMDEMPDAYHTVSIEDIVSFSKAMFRTWTQDEFSSLFRKMLTIEQFRSEEMGKLYQQYLCNGPVMYVSDILAGLGYAQPMDKAIAFYAPMFLLYSVYDRAQDKAAVIAAADAALEEAGRRLTEEKRRD